MRRDVMVAPRPLVQSPPPAAPRPPGKNKRDKDPLPLPGGPLPGLLDNKPVQDPQQKDKQQEEQQPPEEGQGAPPHANEIDQQGATDALNALLAQVSVGGANDDPFDSVFPKGFGNKG
jgi:hypothetical protein